MGPLRVQCHGLAASMSLNLAKHAPAIHVFDTLSRTRKELRSIDSVAKQTKDLHMQRDPVLVKPAASQLPTT